MEFSARQRQIIDAAIQIISDRGIQQLTVKNLAASLGLSEGAIYRHFASKRQILQGIIVLLQEIFQQAKDKINQADGTEPEKLNEFFLCCLLRLSQHPTLAAVIFADDIFKFDNQLENEIFATMQKTQELITDLVKNGQAKGHIRTDVEASALAIMFSGAIRLVVTQWRLSNYSFDLMAKGKKVLDNLLKLIQNK